MIATTRLNLLCTATLFLFASHALADPANIELSCSGTIRHHTPAHLREMGDLPIKFVAVIRDKTVELTAGKSGVFKISSKTQGTITLLDSQNAPGTQVVFQGEINRYDGSFFLIEMPLDQYLDGYASGKGIPTNWVLQAVCGQAPARKF